MILDPTYTHVTGQSLSQQGYIPPTLVYPANQSPASQTQANQPVLNNSSHPRGDASSYPKMGASGYTPYDSTVTSASSYLSPQVYQWPSSGGQPYQYNYSSPNTTPGYASYPPSATKQPCQVDERFQGTTRSNADVTNNNGAEYYNSQYYSGYY